MKLARTFLIACLGATPLCAQQAEPKPPAANPAPPAPAGKPSGGDPTGNPPPAGRHAHHRQAQGVQEQKPVAYIGVLTREVTPELRAQFSLEEGFGLLVDEVLPDSPARAAGLKVYDVLVKFEDQKLVNMEQFMTLVRARKKGDVVQLDVITGGKEIQVPVTLGEHLAAAGPHLMPHGGMPFMNDHEQPGFQNHPNALREQMERQQHFQQEMREYQERVQDWARGGRSGPMPQMPGSGQQPHGGGRHHSGHPSQTGISIPPGTDLERFKASRSHSATQVTRRDDSGEYTLKNEDGQKTFIVRPQNGREQSWPVNSEAERQAIPEELRDKLKMMDGAENGIRIEIRPGPGKDAPAGEAKPPAVPSVKGGAASA